jgi:hypothetical protein
MSGSVRGVPVKVLAGYDFEGMIAPLRVELPDGRRYGMVF